jgi:hypothetical protein
MLKLFLLIVLAMTAVPQTFAQSLFPDRCLGVWKGTMHIYAYGTLKDSVEVRLTVARTTAPDAWTWKTEYLSEKLPAVKDYVVRLKDREKNLYVTDEGEGLELTDYLVGNKMYSVFETEGILLTSSYELRGQELIFEVSSGKKEPASHPSVTNYSVRNLQRVVFRRME